MSIQKTQRFCPSCRRYVLAERPGAEHTVHALITIFTCGLWLLVWLLASIRIGGWRCPVCGSYTQYMPSGSLTRRQSPEANEFRLPKIRNYDEK